MKDLQKLYTTTLFYEALEGVCAADEDTAYMKVSLSLRASNVFTANRVLM